VGLHLKILRVFYRFAVIENFTPPVLNNTVGSSVAHFFKHIAD